MPKMIGNWIEGATRIDSQAVMLPAQSGTQSTRAL